MPTLAGVVINKQVQVVIATQTRVGIRTSPIWAVDQTRLSESLAMELPPASLMPGPRLAGQPLATPTTGRGESGKIPIIVSPLPVVGVARGWPARLAQTFFTGSASPQPHTIISPHSYCSWTCASLGLQANLPAGGAL